MKKNLVIFFPTDEKITSAFEYLRPSLEVRQMQMLSKIPQTKVDIYIVRNNKNFLWANKFLPQFQLIWTSWSSSVEKEVIFWDLVFGFNMPEDTTHRYPCNIGEITLDKSIIEEIFPDLTLKSIKCTNYKEILKNFTKIQSELKVLKPISESRGRWMHISKTIPKKEDLLDRYYPYLLQEFFDTSKWFYKLCKWLHDFRVIILNGEIIAQILREPEQNKLISNTDSGGSLTDIFNFVLPKEVLDIVRQVESYCSRYEHRYYSIDMWVWQDWAIKIFELNSAPALSNEHIAHMLWDYTAKNILKVS